MILCSSSRFLSKELLGEQLSGEQGEGVEQRGPSTAVLDRIQGSAMSRMGQLCWGAAAEVLSWVVYNSKRHNGAIDSCEGSFVQEGKHCDSARVLLFWHFWLCSHAVPHDEFVLDLYPGCEAHNRPLQICSGPRCVLQHDECGT